ncbi:MAG: hypothetical protein IPL65_11445 [Lewinellaceae bacterium]|nr:hypothetical protein [Lewinellaceae bacterium]
MNFFPVLRRASLVLLFAVTAFQQLSAQINVTCNTPANARWQPYLNWIAPAQPLTNAITLSITRYSANTFSLSINTLASNMPNMKAFGKVSFRKTELEGVSCLKTTNIFLRNPANGVGQSIPISCAFFAAAQLGANPGHITLGNIGFTRSASSGDTHLFKRDDGGEFLVVHFKKEVLF